MSNIFFACEEVEDDTCANFIFDLGGTAIAFADVQYEDKLYKKAVEELKDVSFDGDFVEICNNPEFVIDGKLYKGKDFNLRTLDSGEVYFSNLRDKEINLFTGEKMTGKIISSTSVYKSTLFYDLYKDGIITEKPIIVDKDIFLEYKDNWDGKMHDKTFSNAIDLKIAEYVREDRQ